MHPKELFIFLDIEATMINGKQHIIEIGAYKWSPNEAMGTFEQLIKPSKRFKKLNRHIQHLTGITTEELLKASSFLTVMENFIDFCGGTEGEKVFVTFGEFDRKVLEEEFKRHRLNMDFLYPIVDFQQKYMINHQLKNQPSLHSLLDALNLEIGQQHRALADAESLMRIFCATDGVQMIESQKTNEFVLLLGDLSPKEDVYETTISYMIGQVESDYIVVKDIQTVEKNLPYEIREVEKITGENETTIVQVHDIQPNEELRNFLHQILQQLDQKVLITMAGFQTISKITRLHGTTLPKIETITLKHLIKDENERILLNTNNETLNTDLKLIKLVDTYQEVIIEEFTKRNLLKNKVNI